MYFQTVCRSTKCGGYLMYFPWIRSVRCIASDNPAPATVDGKPTSLQVQQPANVILPLALHHHHHHPDP